MKRRASSRFLALVFALISVATCTGLGLAQEPKSAIPTRDLPDDQLAAGLVKDHPIGLPSPPELLFVLSKEGSPKWRQLYHPVLKDHETDRIKTALRLGLSIAEGHLATMARDAQKIRDVTNDLQQYAKVLGISDGLAENARSINSLAEAKAWSSIAFELEALAAQASSILEAQRDGELASLITTGLWIRILQVSTSVVTEEDFEDTTLAISNHATLEKLVSPHQETKSPTIQSIRDQLAKIQRLWSPQKLESGRKFDNALIKDSNGRLNNIVNQFTR